MRLCTLILAGLAWPLCKRRERLPRTRWPRRRRVQPRAPWVGFKPANRTLAGHLHASPAMWGSCHGLVVCLTGP